MNVEGKVYQNDMWEVNKPSATFSVDPYLGGMCQDQWVSMGAMLDCSLSWQDVHKVLDCVGQCSLQLGGGAYVWPNGMSISWPVENGHLGGK